MEFCEYTYEQAVEYLLNIPKFTGKNSLQDTRDFLVKLGSPEKKMKIIHIAGTNGKGSVCAYLRGILMEMGYSVGTFTSPHLIDVNERIQINGIPVSDEELLTTFEQIIALVQKLKQEESSTYHPSFFEFLFFIGILIFEKRMPDYVILETGMGGRLDATNCVESPLIAIITKIGMDHMQYLGDTLEAIAGEKAGIIKSQIPVVYWAGVAEAAAVIEGRATALGAKALPVSNHDYAFLNFKNKTIDFSYYSRYYDYVRLCLDTAAFYQMENASLALRAAEELFPGGEVTPKVMEQALYKTHWEGRMEEVAPGVFVDGAHNEDGIQAFLDSVSRDGSESRRTLIFGAVSDKAYTQMIKQITESRLFFRIAVVNMDNGRALSADELRNAFEEQGVTQISVWPDVRSAYEALMDKCDEGELIYIAGSLYLVGEFKGYLRMRGSHD